MDERTQQTIIVALPLVALLVVFLLGALTLRPFAPALLWAVFVSIALLPLHTNLADRLGGRRGLATLLMAIGLVVVVLLPMLLLLRAILGFLPEFALGLIENERLTGGLVHLPPNTPANWVAIWHGIQKDLDSLRTLIGEDIRALVSTVLLEGRIVGSFVLEFLLGLVLATLMLQHAPALGRAASGAVERLGGVRGVQLGERSVLTIRYTVLGILGSAAVQTAIAAFAYWIVGAPHWPLLAFVTFMLGLLQVGPILIWGPLAIWLWLDGHIGLAVFLIVWGLVVVGISDNLVKAAVVSRGADLPAVLVFLGAIGGLFVWGVVGVFVGPVILAICMGLTLWWLGLDRSEESGQQTGEETVPRKGPAV